MSTGSSHLTVLTHNDQSTHRQAIARLERFEKAALQLEEMHSAMEDDTAILHHVKLGIRGRAARYMVVFTTLVLTLIGLIGVIIGIISFSGRFTHFGGIWTSIVVEFVSLLLLLTNIAGFIGAKSHRGFMLYCFEVSSIILLLAEIFTLGLFGILGQESALEMYWKTMPYSGRVSLQKDFECCGFSQDSPMIANPCPQVHKGFCGVLLVHHLHNYMIAFWMSLAVLVFFQLSAFVSSRWWATIRKRNEELERAVVETSVDLEPSKSHGGDFPLASPQEGVSQRTKTPSLPFRRDAQIVSSPKSNSSKLSSPR